MDIAIETDSPELIDEVRAIQGLGDSLTSTRRGMDGATLVTVVLTLTPPIIAAVTSIIRTHIGAKKHVRVTRHGMVIEGVSEETLIKILEDERQRDTL